MRELKAQFECYYTQYQDMVHTLCLGYAKGDIALRDDLVQETFLNLWKALPRFQGKSSPKTWIYRICVNTCLLDIRKNKKRKAEALQSTHRAIAERAPVDKSYQSLYQAIGQLKELDRVIVMLVLEDLPYAEIAAITGIKEGHLRVKISRAKQKLNNLLRHD